MHFLWVKFDLFKFKKYERHKKFHLIFSNKLDIKFIQGSLNITFLKVLHKAVISGNIKNILTFWCCCFKRALYKGLVINYVAIILTLLNPKICGHKQRQNKEEDKVHLKVTDKVLEQNYVQGEHISLELKLCSLYFCHPDMSNL